MIHFLSIDGDYESVHPPAMNQMGKNIDNEIYRLLIEAVTDYAIFALDTEGYITTWNPGIERLKGYAAEDIIGKHFSVFYTPEDVERNHPQNELKIAIEKGKYEEEGWRVRKDGTRFWANIIINKLNDSKGQFIGFAKVTRDLTEKMMAQRALQESEERNRLLIKGVKDYAIFMLDVNGNVATWNEGAQRINQYSTSEIVGRPISVFYTKEDIETKKAEKEIAESKRVGHFEDEGWRVRKDGTRFWANVILTALKNDHGELIGFSKITRDLTERKSAEEKLKEAYNSLEIKVEERTHELSLAADRLEAAVKARDQFLSMASHELKTPLTTLKLQSQLRRKTLEKSGEKSFTLEKLTKMFNDDERQVDRLTRLVDDMLDITRLNVGKLSLKKEKCRLDELMGDLVDRYIPQFQGVQSKVSYMADEVEGQWDPYRLEQVFSNLLTNAIKYSPGTAIDVRVIKKADIARVEVQDHGKGIAPEDQKRIFEQFERATSMNDVGGLGLGLFIVKQIVTSHQGRIWVESEVGRGSTFIVELPL